MAYLTVPVCETTEEKFLEGIALAAEVKPDILELRTDFIHNLTYDTLENIIAKARSLSLPVLITCRDGKEGGMHAHSPLVRLEILCEAVRLGVQYIDCEFANYQNPQFRSQIDKALAGSKCRLILSCHNFVSPFENIAAVYEQIYAANNDCIVKIAYMANHINDCFAGFDVLRSRKGDAIVACMGAAGAISRILASKTGNFITFAGSRDDKQSAPGQLSVSVMRNLYRFDNIDAQTSVYGIIANPVAHSASPAVYNALFSSAGHNCVYVPLLLEGDRVEFDGFMNNIRTRPWLGFKGFSVTIPHKVNAFEYVRTFGSIDKRALLIGAINTISVDEGGAVSGFNTDYAGLLNPLKKALPAIEGKKAAVIGAGGVAKAVLSALIDSGVKAVIFNRTKEKGEQLARYFRCDCDGLENIGRLGSEGFEIVINCTSLGMSPNIGQSPVPVSVLKKNMTVFDTVYNPVQTLLLKDAAAAGAATITGLEMFIEQAQEQYSLLTGLCPDRDIIEAVLKEKLKI